MKNFILYLKNNSLSTAAGLVGLVLAAAHVLRSPDPIAAATSEEMIALVALSLGAVLGQDPKALKPPNEAE